MLLACRRQRGERGTRASVVAVWRALERSGCWRLLHASERRDDWQVARHDEPAGCKRASARSRSLAAAIAAESSAVWRK